MMDKNMKPLIILTGPTAVGTVHRTGKGGGRRDHIRRFHAGI